MVVEPKGVYETAPGSHSHSAKRVAMAALHSTIPTTPRPMAVERRRVPFGALLPSRSDRMDIAMPMSATPAPIANAYPKRWLGPAIAMGVKAKATVAAAATRSDAGARRPPVTPALIFTVSSGISAPY